MYLPASTTGFYLVDTDRVWVEAQPKETTTSPMSGLANARRSQSTPIPDGNGTSTVESIGPASESEFSLLPAENTSGNWVKVVQRIPLRVHMDLAAQGTPPLRAGMSVEVSVYTGHKRGLPHFLTALIGVGGSG
jgi:membrane fusion protein (multidrug efflux system)